MKRNKKILNQLNASIAGLCENPENFIVNPEKDFTRNRKLNLYTVIRTLLAMQNKSLSHELLEIFGFAPDTPSASAFVQQRAKIKHEAFEQIFKTFTNSALVKFKTYRGYRLLAADGSQIAFSSNPNDPDSFFICKKSNYNLLHLNVMYDLLNCIYTDAVIQKERRENERAALVNMVDNSTYIGSNVIVIADRGYESYNTLAHIQEKGWKFLFRFRNCKTSCILSGFDFPEGEFDIELPLVFTRSRRNIDIETAKNDKTFKVLTSQYTFDYLPKVSKDSDEAETYSLNIRFVRFSLSDGSYEVVATNLDKDDFPPYELKKLYSMRWGVETSFRNLKYTVGLLSFHSKKVEYIFQEIFSRLIMYNFSELITSHVVVQRKNQKYSRKINFSETVLICRNFFLDKISPQRVEVLISHHLSPVRPGRHHPRKMKPKGASNFIYRIA